jgi:hypothetical protein
MEVNLESLELYRKKKTNISGKHPRGIRETGFLKNVKQFFRCVEPIKINKGSL